MITVAPKCETFTCLAYCNLNHLTRNCCVYERLICRYRRSAYGHLPPNRIELSRVKHCDLLRAGASELGVYFVAPAAEILVVLGHSFLYPIFLFVRRTITIRIVTPVLRCQHSGLGMGSQRLRLRLHWSFASGRCFFALADLWDAANSSKAMVQRYLFCANFRKFGVLWFSALLFLMLGTSTPELT